MERLELRGVAARSTLRMLICAAFALTLFIVGRPADAAELTDVRVGKHQGYTRVVLELDSLTGYQVSEPKGGGDAVLRVELHASASERALTPKNALVKGVSIVPSGRSATVELSLSKAELQINEMILLSPPRLVFDLRDPTAVVAKPVAPAKKKTPLAKKKNTEPKVVAAKTTKPAPPKKAEPKKATSPPASAAEPEKAAAPPALEVAKLNVSDAKANASDTTAETADIVAQVAGGASAEAKSVLGDSAGAAAKVADSSKLAERANLVKQALPAGAAISDGGAPKDAAGLAALRAKNQGRPALSAPPTASKPGVNPTTSSRKPIAIPASPPASTADTSVMSQVKAMIPTGNLLYIIGGAVLALVALVFVLRRRGGNDDALSPVMAADHLGGGEDDLFASDDGGATEPVPTMPGHTAPAPKMDVAAPPAAAPTSATPSGGGNLETRVGELENRLQGLADAREQIERQLSAQTEELRVQRAAIARTQRVVRSIGDGEEDTGATEPVPRAPGQAQA